MRDVLGTIQADQDAIIRAGSRGALVVEGGPGTGKTVVALHRAAYLLYSDPHLGHGRGHVLFIGPHRPYLAYIGDVLPSLGEEGVQTCTVRDLIAEGATATIEADPDVARLKSSANMIKAIDAAVRIYERPPTQGMTVTTDVSDIRLSAGDWVEAFAAPDPDTPHNEAREQIWEELLTILVDKLDERFDGDGVADGSADVLRSALEQDRELRATFNRAWLLSKRPTSSETCGRSPPISARVLPGSAPTTCSGCSARTPTPGRCPTFRSWTQRGSGSATRRCRAVGAGGPPRARPNASRWPWSLTTSARFAATSTARAW